LSTSLSWAGEPTDSSPSATTEPVSDPPMQGEVRFQISGMKPVGDGF
jgi:hypothetical protein